MRQLAPIFLFLILGTAHMSFGQEYRYNYSLKNVKKLKKVNAVNAGKIHIKMKVNKNEDIFIFLINRTDSLLKPYLGHSQSINFTKEAIDTDGNWKLIDHSVKLGYQFICGNGIQHLKLDPGHYTWNKLLKADYTGNFSTSVRFSYRLNDSLTIVSKPLSTKINYDLFLPSHERVLLHLDSLLVTDTLVQKKRERAFLLKSQIYYKYKSIEETIKVTHEIVEAYPEWVKSKYKLSRYLLRYISTNRNDLTDFQISLILSKTMALWEQTPKEYKNIYERSQEYLKKYTKFLLTENEWRAQSDIPFERINEDYYSQLALLNGGSVKIKFRLNHKN